MSKPGRNLFVFTDGTGNAGGKTRETNVYRLYRAIDRNAADPKQRTFYDDGVGTSDNAVTRLLGNVFGLGLSANIRELYEWLVLNYKPGDRIFIFGFSRGAFTARCLAGVITRCGLLKRDVYTNTEDRPKQLKQILWAYRAVYQRAYKRWHGAENNYYRPRTCFVGVWDTVDAVGMPIDELRPLLDYASRLFLCRRAYAFSDMRLTGVEHARHAISIDDERRTFHPNVWFQSRKAARQAIDPQDPRRPTEAKNIRQVWFAGAHSNVGGGYPQDQLAHISLDWMMGELEALDGAPVHFLKGKRKFFQDEANEYGRQYDPRTGPAVYYRYSPRRITRFYKGTDGFWERILKLRGSNPPALPSHGIELHASVFKRIERGSQGYAPLFLPDHGDEFRLAVNFTGGSGPYTEAHLGADLKEVGDRVAAVASKIRSKVSVVVILRQCTYAIMLGSTAYAVCTGYLSKSPHYTETAAGQATGPLGKLIAMVLPDFALPLVNAAFAHPGRATLYLVLVVVSWGAGRFLRNLIRRIGRKAYDEGMAANFVLKGTADNQFMFNLVASNGEVILTSERYTAKASAENGIESVRTNSPLCERYDRRTSKSDEPYFVLKARNGEVIGTSEMYSSKQAVERGIQSVKMNGPTTSLDDQT